MQITIQLALYDKILAIEQKKENISYITQQNSLPSLKRKYPEYSWVYSKVLQPTLRMLDANFKSFFALKKKQNQKVSLPRYRGKRYFTPLIYNQS
ncbi:MAG: hypothetical protein ACE5FT_03295 [Candidatus Nanoarchaeia archaeon]